MTRTHTRRAQILAAGIDHVRTLIDTDPATGETTTPTRRTYDSTRPPTAPGYSTLLRYGLSWPDVLAAALAPPGDPCAGVIPVRIVTGNISSDEGDEEDEDDAKRVIMATRLPATLAAEIAQRADDAGLSKSEWMIRAAREKTRRPRRTPIDDDRSAAISFKAPPALSDEIRRQATGRGISIAQWLIEAITEGAHPRPDPLSDPAYAALPQPQRDPYSGELIPPRDGDGHPIWRVRVARNEHTCKQCGEAFIMYRGFNGRAAGFCPVCSAGEEAGRRQRLNAPTPSVETTSYLAPEEYTVR